MKKNISQQLKNKIKKYQASPLPFIKDMWGLTPQKIKEESRARFQIFYEDKRYNEITADFFEEYQEGKHLTWQQFLILKAVENAVQGKGKKRDNEKTKRDSGSSPEWHIPIYFLYTNLLIKPLKRDIKIK